MPTSFKPYVPAPHGTVVDCIRDLVRGHGGAEKTAEALGVKANSVYGYTSETDGADISFAKVCALTNAEHPEAAIDMARRAGGEFIPLAGCKDLDASKLTADCMRSHGEAMGMTLEALADRVITPKEAGQALEVIDAALCDLAALRARMIAARGGK